MWPLTRWSPSRPIQITLTCGLPSGVIVARWTSGPGSSNVPRAVGRIVMASPSYGRVFQDQGRNATVRSAMYECDRGRSGDDKEGHAGDQREDGQRRGHHAAVTPEIGSA